MGSFQSFDRSELLRPAHCTGSRVFAGSLVNLFDLAFGGGFSFHHQGVEDVTLHSQVDDLPQLEAWNRREPHLFGLALVGARALGIGRDDNLPVFIDFLLNQRPTHCDLFDADAQLSRGFRKRGRYWRGQLKYRFIHHR